MKFGQMLPILALALIAAPMSLPFAQQTAPTAGGQATVAERTGYLELGDMNVVTPNGDKIGEVEEVLMDASGKVVAVAVEVGGFLGIGDDDVIIPLDQLRLENEQLVTTLTKEQIEALPKWDD